MAIQAFAAADPLQMGMIHQFIRHYRERVDKIHLFINSDTLPGISDEQVLLHSWPHKFSCGTSRWFMGEYFKFTMSDGWALQLDIDELVYHDLRELAADAESSGAQWVRGVMIDRLAADGSFPRIGAATDLLSTFPVRARITECVAKGATSKVILSRYPHFGDDPHRLRGFEGSVHRVIYDVEHFKWDHNLRERMKKRVQSLAGAGHVWAHEPQTTLDYIGNNDCFDMDRLRADGVLL